VRPLPDTVYRVIGRLAVSRVSRVLHPVLYRRASGRGVLGRFLGAEMILLTTRGRRSGKPRTAAVFAAQVPDGWAVVPSAGGTGRISSWYSNLLDEPRATIQHRDLTILIVASETDGAERDRLFDLVATAYPGMRAYQARTTKRLPVLLLRPADLDRN
jgi:deazaflavin-dependent oxidoreductase (nitroreductase family)